MNKCPNCQKDTIKKCINCINGCKMCSYCNYDMDIKKVMCSNLVLSTEDLDKRTLKILYTICCGKCDYVLNLLMKYGRFSNIPIVKIFYDRL